MEHNDIARLVNYGKPFSETIQIDDILLAATQNVMSVGVITMTVACKELLISNMTYAFNFMDGAGADQVGSGWIELQNGTNDINNCRFAIAPVAPAIGFVQRVPRLTAGNGVTAWADLNWLINNFYAGTGFVGVVQASASVYAAAANPVNVYHRLTLAGFYL